ncbi:hypothetical protein BH24PSE2_BH24PSE2_23930 [soil metagenome]
MAAGDFDNARRLGYAIVLGQLGVTSLAATLFLVAAGGRAGYSAFLGGAIGTLASLYMAASFFRGGAGADPEQILRSVYVGEFVKLMMTAVLFVMAITLLDVDFLPLIVAYVATFFVYWLALLKAMPQTTRNQ